jgi:Tfp pilus assembly protein PilV
MIDKLENMRGLPRRLALPTPQSNVAGTFDVPQGRRPWEEVRGVWGQSLFEVLFAVAIAAIILVGVVSLSTTSIRNTSYSNNNALATKYAQEAVEWLRGQRDEGFSIFQNHAADSTIYCLDASPFSWGNTGACSGSEFITGTFFLRSVAFVCYKTDPTDPTSFVSEVCSDVDVNNIESTVEVKWTDTQGEHEVRTVTRFTDWRR